MNHQDIFEVLPSCLRYTSYLIVLINQQLKLAVYIVHFKVYIEHLFCFVYILLSLFFRLLPTFAQNFSLSTSNIKNTVKSNFL